MRFRLSAILWIALPCWGLSQTSPVIDSLNQYIQDHPTKDSLYVHALNRLAYEYYVDNPKKLELAYQARAIAIEIEYPKGEAEAYRQMGMVAWGQSNFSLALKHFIEGLKIAESIRDQQAIANLTGNIGLVYQGLGDYVQALNFQQKSLALQRKIKNKLRESVALNNLGHIKRALKEYDEAIDYYSQALALSKDIGNHTGYAASILNLGKIYEEKQVFHAALEHYFNSMKVYDVLQEKRGMTQCRFFIASAYFSTQQFKEASAYAKESLALAKKGNFKAFIRDAYLLLSQIGEAQNNPAGSFQFFKLYTAYKDSVMNLETASEIASQRLEYETQKKQVEIDLLKKEADLHLSTIVKKNTLLAFIGITLLLLFSLTAILFKNYAQEKRTNRMLNATNEEIEKQHREITEQRNQLIALNEKIQGQQQEVLRNHEELAEKNASIADMNRKILEINENLEKIIVQRTSALKKQNQQLIEYSSINANKLKAPMTRITELIRLLDQATNAKEQQFHLTSLRQATNEMDSITRSISAIVHEGLEAYKKQFH